MLPASARRPRLAIVVHAIRVAVVAALLLAIPPPMATPSSGSRSVAPPLDLVQRGIHDAVEVIPSVDANGLWAVRNRSGQTVGFSARTLPEAVDAVGYRGPTDALIVFDGQLKIVSVALLESADTPEHVEAVRADAHFFEQFRRWSWGGPEADMKIDAVSGATLTSLALAEGVLKRIGGNRPSLLFPQPLTVDEVKNWFPKAQSVSVEKSGAVVRADHQQVIGRVIRSGLFSDDINGYQGPSEVLMKLTVEDQLESIRLRSSYDNEPYVDYVRTETAYWALFENRTLDELAMLDVEAAGIEGVSGATMTSLAVADTIVATAKGVRAARDEPPQRNEVGGAAHVRWTVADIATVVTLLLAAALGRFRLFRHRTLRHRTLRRLWLGSVVIVIGWWAGNLISMALVAGWSAAGIAWRLAPGLAAIVTVALVGPPLSKSNPYCNHLCPHGALQQLIKPRRKASWRYHPSRKMSRHFARIPGLSLVVAYVWVVANPAVDLSSWEPFHAYLFRIAGWGSIAFAALSLAGAAMVPMAYCRFGCPTGRLLDHLRRTATSDRIQTADYVSVGLLALAIGLRYC